MDIPDGLRGIGPFMQRAQELKQRDPVMAYHCLLYAANTGMNILETERTEAGEKFIMAMLDELEQLKAAARPYPEMADEHASATHVMEFALKVFAAADNAERSGNLTKYPRRLNNHGPVEQRERCSWRRPTFWRC